MNKYIIPFVCFLWLPNFLLAQAPTRRGSLGVGFYTTVPDSLRVRLNAPATGAVVQFVVPNSTASKLGIQPNDIILSVNNSQVLTPRDLSLLASKLRTDATVQLNWMRAGKMMTGQGQVLTRPMEVDSSATIEYGWFAYQGGFVRTIYKQPKRQAPIGTIYFLQGIPCYSLDDLRPLDKTKQAIDALVDEGFAVYRMEKGDMGDNVGMTPCVDMGFHEELAMYQAGYKNLLQLPGVDTSRIILFGHSMGGVVAPLLAAQFQPKAVVVYGTVFKRWGDYLMDAFVLQSSMRGESSELLQETLASIRPELDTFFQGNRPARALASTPQGLRALQYLLDYSPKTGLAAAGRKADFHRELHAYNLADYWARTHAKVLAVYGECDIAAIHPNDHIALVDFVNQTRPGSATFWQAPRASHMFEEIGTMNDYLALEKNMAALVKYGESRFTRYVFTYIGAWMRAALV